MSGNVIARRRLKLSESGGWASTVGRIVAVSSDGAPSVDFDGNSHGPIRALVLTSAVPIALGDEVLLAFANGDAMQPIVVGPVANRLPTAMLEVHAPDRPLEVSVDRERVVLQARSEIVLRCGKSSITMLADGKIVIKGTELISRSSGANKIKGALVNIN